MSTKWALIVTFGLLGVMAGVSLWLLPQLPEQVPIHWNIQGEPDGWAPRGTAILMFSGLGVFMMLFLIFGQWLSPKGWEVESFRRTFNLIMVYVIGLVVYMHGMSLYSAIRPGLQTERALVIGLMIFFALIGNLLGKTRKNFWMGIRVPWTLANDQVWAATHRLAAWMFVGAGVIGSVLVLLGMPLWTPLVLLALAIVVPIVYSFVLYKKLESWQLLRALAPLLLVPLALGGVTSGCGAQERVAQVTGPVVEDREVAFSGRGGLELKGTLSLPAAERKGLPAVLLIPGSGPTDRDGNQGPLQTDLLKQFSQRLVSEGYVTLRYDKRAVPATYGERFPSEQAEMEDFFSWESFVEDARAAVAFLRGRAEVDPDRVTVFGHSEGGMIALELGAGEAPPAGLILVATPGRPLSEVLMDQLKRAHERGQLPENLLVEAQNATRRLVKGEPLGEVPPELVPLYPPYATRYLRSMMTMNPIAKARAFPGPALVLQGEQDIQVSPTLDAPPLYRALQDRLTDPAELELIPGASHNLKRVHNPAVEPGFAGPVVPEALDKVVSWLRAQEF
jgi:uncharacterized protein